jgi:hypothetical protein
MSACDGAIACRGLDSMSTTLVSFPCLYRQFSWLVKNALTAPWPKIINLHYKEDKKSTHLRLGRGSHKLLEDQGLCLAAVVLTILCLS